MSAFGNRGEKRKEAREDNWRGEVGSEEKIMSS